MRKVCIIQARMGSSRLPGKVMKPLAGKETLWHVWDRVRHCSLIDEIVIATSTEPADQHIEDYCKREGWNITQLIALNRKNRYSITNTPIVTPTTANVPIYLKLKIVFNY